MTTRETVITNFSNLSPFTTGNYDRMKSCINLKDGQDINTLDIFFEGIIRSLNFAPNKNLVVFECNCENDVSEFFKQLVYEPLYADSSFITDDELYHKLIVNFEFSKRTLNYYNSDFFKVFEPSEEYQYHYAEKRLCSFISITDKWRFPQRKNVNVLNVTEVDLIKLRSVDIKAMWNEIFYTYNPKLCSI
jgi:hypothetical protein